MTEAERTFWSLDDQDSNEQRVRSAFSDVAFLAVLILMVGASWLWGPKISVVLSESMKPTYTAGDALLVVPWGTPGVGDIAQFRVPLAPGQAETTVPVSHRIIGQDERGFITKGDNPMANPDYWRVTPDMIEGQVIFWMPRVWMFRIASGLIGIALLLFLWPKSDEEEPGELAVTHMSPEYALPAYPQRQYTGVVLASPQVQPTRPPGFPRGHPASAPSAFPKGRPTTAPVVFPQGRPIPLPPPNGANWGAS